MEEQKYGADDLEFMNFDVIVVQSLSCVQLFVTPWTAAHQASLSFSVFRSVLKFMSVESVMLSNHPILCFMLTVNWDDSHNNLKGHYYCISFTDEKTEA